jgi:hypothetical protein
VALEGSISDAFEGALRLYVAEEERELTQHLGALLREEAERKWAPADDDSGAKVRAGGRAAGAGAGRRGGAADGAAPLLRLPLMHAGARLSRDASRPPCPDNPIPLLSPPPRCSSPPTSCSSRSAPR